ncbi:hypothetical protein [Taklimakanibacter lacteus]|uniref:hypothetical protein n=1 Tax=Taklimakanibacter lacteus TaxID=2268456 RepID=UPI000E66A156
MSQAATISVPKLERLSWLAAAFAFAVLLQLELVINRPINWDEFFHLSEAHAFHEGRLAEVLQVFYARAFFWLPMLPVDAVDQIRIARLFMFGCELFTTYAIYAMAGRFVGRMPAALAALAYLTGGYVFQHGFSYRADPMAAAFLMGALWIILASRLDTRAILLAAILAGLAVLTTIKVVFYAPAFAGIAWLRWSEAADRKGMLLRLAAFAGAAVAFALLLIGATILTLPDANGGSAARTVSTSVTMMFDQGLFPTGIYALRGMLFAPFMALLVLATPFVLARAQLSRPQCVALIALLMPLVSIVFYRNSYPYFYAYILPPVMVGAAIAVKAVQAHISAGILSLALLANAATISLTTSRPVLPAQKQVLAAAGEIFPEPVAYFDYPGMLADFPKANFFMTNWGMRKYRIGQEASFVDAMSRETVPLLVVNHVILASNQTGPAPSEALLPEDGRALREAFIPHWGPLWVAGRRFSAATKEQTFFIHAPGIYTLEKTSARIDGHVYAPGQTLTLARGAHRFEQNSAGEAVLRWGSHLTRPSWSFADGPIFEGF